MAMLSAGNEVGALTKVLLLGNPAQALTVLSNFDKLANAHYGETCFAWLKSFDSNYDEINGGRAFNWNGSGGYRKVLFNCPVDIEVFDKNDKLVASIINNVANDGLDTTILATVDEDEEKAIMLPANEDFNITITATGDGTMDYSVNEYNSSVDDYTRIDNFKAVTIKAGDILYAGVPEYSEADSSNGIEGTNTHYTLTGIDGAEILATESIKGEDARNADYMITVKSENEELGIVEGEGFRVRGNFAEVRAIPNEGYKFIGWYEGEEKVSDEEVYRFRVENDRTLVARFEKIEEPTQEPTQDPTEEPTEEPTQEPTQEPTEEPTEEPTQEPTKDSTQEPTQQPNNTKQPTAQSNGGASKAQVVKASNAKPVVAQASKTGDTNLTALWITLSAVSAGIVTAMVVAIRKRRAE